MSVDSQLGDVKPWVRSAADKLTDLFGLTTVYGWRAQDAANTTTGHANGLAVDFPMSKSLGERFVAYVQQNAQALGVQYLIWQQRMWKPATGWTAMAHQGGSRPGYDPNHERHVHISWNATAPTGNAALSSVSTVANVKTAGVSMNPLDVLNPSSWFGGVIKVVGVLAGATLVILGLASVAAGPVASVAKEVL